MEIERLLDCIAEELSYREYSSISLRSYINELLDDYEDELGVDVVNELLRMSKAIECGDVGNERCIQCLENIRVELEDMQDKDIKKKLQTIRDQILNEADHTPDILARIVELVDKGVGREEFVKWVESLDDRNAQYFDSTTYDPLDDSEC